MNCPCCGKAGYGIKKDAKPTQRQIDSFWSRVEKTDGCWIFQGGKSHAYGRMRFGESATLAHVISWMICYGKKPTPGMVLAHSCDNKRCVKIAHLSEKTNAQNVKEAFDRGLMVMARGEKSTSSKLSDLDTIDIRTRLLNKTSTISELAKEKGVTFQSIYRIAIGKRADMPTPVIEIKNPRRLGVWSVKAIRAWNNDPEVTQKQIAEKFCIDQSHVSKICSGQRFKQKALNA